MKLRLITTAILALAGMASITQPAKAATTYATGDLILGIEDQNGNVTNDYEIDLGSITTFINYNNNAAGTVTIGNFGADLTSIFGANWNNISGSTNVAWAIAGTTGTTAGTIPGLAVKTIILTNPETTPGTAGTKLSSFSSTQQGGFLAGISTMANGGGIANGQFNGQAANGTTAANATQVASSASSSFTSQEGGSGFGTGYTIFNDFAGSVSGVNGTAGSVSDLNILQPNPTGSSNIGSFKFNDSGILTFTTANTVPEPSTYVLMGLGSVLLLVWQTRRRYINNL